MDTPLLEKLYKTPEASRFREMLRACMFHRPAVYDEVNSCVLYPDEHPEEVYEMALTAYFYATCPRSTLQFAWDTTTQSK